MTEENDRRPRAPAELHAELHAEPPLEVHTKLPPDSEVIIGGTHPDSGTLSRCELCGGPILDRHCKVLCLNCGFHRDCSDP